jgi:hypothetical protein
LLICITASFLHAFTIKHAHIIPTYSDIHQLNPIGVILFLLIRQRTRFSNLRHIAPSNSNPLTWSCISKSCSISGWWTTNHLVYSKLLLIQHHSHQTIAPLVAFWVIVACNSIL